MKMTNSAKTIVKAIINTINAAREVAVEIRKALDANNDLIALGEAIGAEWAARPRNREEGTGARLLMEACSEANLSREESRWLVKATGLVSTPRVSQLEKAVFGPSSGKGGAPKKKKKPAAFSFDAWLKAMPAKLNAAQKKEVVAALAAR